MYASMMSLTVFFAGMSSSLCCRVIASQSSTSHGFNSSGILILISTLLKNCSSVSTDVSRPRFFFGPSSALALRDELRLLVICSVDPGVAVAGFVDRLRDVDDDDVVDVFNGAIGVDFSSFVSSFDGVDARESLSLPVTEPSFFGFGAAATFD